MADDELPPDVQEQARRAVEGMREALNAPGDGQPVDQPVPDAPENTAAVPDWRDTEGIANLQAEKQEQARADAFEAQQDGKIRRDAIETHREDIGAEQNEAGYYPLESMPDAEMGKAMDAAAQLRDAMNAPTDGVAVNQPELSETLTPSENYPDVRGEDVEGIAAAQAERRVMAMAEKNPETTQEAAQPVTAEADAPVAAMSQEDLDAMLDARGADRMARDVETLPDAAGQNLTGADGVNPDPTPGVGVPEPAPAPTPEGPDIG